MKKTNSMIIGWGAYHPEKVLTNADLEKMVDTTDEWIKTRSGISERRIVEPGTPNSELSVIAARRALEDAGITAEELDMIILGTVTGDMKFPSTAVFVQSKLGAVNAVAFDISAACSGFLYGLEIADNMINSGKYKKILVIGAEILTSMVDWNDRGTCVLFGDAAGAAVVVPSDGERGLMSSLIKSNGDLTHLLFADGCGSLYPPTVENVKEGKHFIRMTGNEVYKHAVKAMGDSAVEAIKQAELSTDEIKLLFPHQANIRIIQSTAKRAGMPMDKVYVNIDRFGNTSAASIPLAVWEAKNKGLIKKGDNIVMVAFGAGFTWAASALKM